MSFSCFRCLQKCFVTVYPSQGGKYLFTDLVISVNGSRQSFQLSSRAIVRERRQRLFDFLRGSDVDEPAALFLEQTLRDLVSQVIDAQPEGLQGVVTVVVVLSRTDGAFVDNPLVRRIDKYENDEPWSIAEDDHSRLIIVDHSLRLRTVDVESDQLLEIDHTINSFIDPDHTPSHARGSCCFKSVHTYFLESAETLARGFRTKLELSLLLDNNDGSVDHQTTRIFWLPSPPEIVGAVREELFYALQSLGIDKATAVSLKDSIQGLALEANGSKPDDFRGVLTLVAVVLLTVDKYADDPLITRIDKYENDEPQSIAEAMYDRVIVIDHSHRVCTIETVEDVRVEVDSTIENILYQEVGEFDDPLGIESLDDEVITGFEPATGFTIESLLKDTMTFEQMSLTRAEEIECAICLDDFTTESRVASLPCRHVFHVECIVQWLEISRLCPLCRFSFHLNTLPQEE